VLISADVRVAGGVKVYDRYLEIGAGTWVGMDVRLISNRAGTLKIGSRVDIGPMCLVTTGTHEVGGPARRAGVGRGVAVTIGDGTWIGMGAVILPGADIGPGSVVAAGSVVIAGKYPANSLLAGVPARVRRELWTQDG
jgi:acetyltransferase-like isoleucine patch superfamily enzyme